MDRRQFFGAAAVIPLGACATAASEPQGSAAPAAAAPLWQDINALPTRQVTGIEVVYKTPHAHPNGLDVNAAGMWVIDQSDDNWISLINPETGELIREFQAQGIRRASGVHIDDDNVVWVGSTYNRLIVACNINDGSVIARYETPGAGRIYRKAGDPPGRRTTLEPAYPRPPQAPGAPRPTVTLPYGQVAADVEAGTAGTGAHAVRSKGDLLYVDVPPARTIFVINKRSWVVEDMWPVAGNRPHGMSWADASKQGLWCSDSNLNAFFLHDVETGRMTGRLQLPDDSPVIHGAVAHNGYMYFCDDVGWMCRFRL